MQRDLSPRRIIGFACNQAFAFFLFYMGANGAVGVGESLVERADLLFVLAFMVVGFAALRAASNRALNILFSKPVLYVCAVIMAAGSLVSFLSIPEAPQAALFAARGLLAGAPCALLLAAWGRTFGRSPSASSVPEVFLGSLFAAFFCLAFSLIDSASPALLVLCVLPLGSVVNIDIPDGEAAKPSPTDTERDEGFEISTKVLVGTLFFGLAAGLMQTLSTSPGEDAAPFYPVSMVLFGAFVIGALTLLLSDGFGRGAALNKSYRLAVFVMMAGVLAEPWPLPGDASLSGEALVLAGYLGLETVLASLFLVLAEITGQDAARSFSAGFLALFAGQAIGVALSNALSPQLGFAIAGIAGAVILVAYLFLFTERDFDELSQIVEESDDLERACARIVETYGLSNREAEILAFALRGRTSERIAGELVISKSTVDTHLRRIYAKCGVHSRQELIDLAEE